jgi:hypothetical protein
MASVIRFFKRKIKPFKRCVTNPSQLSFERQQQQKRQKSLDDNYYSFKYHDDFNSPETLHGDSTSNKIDGITPASCPSAFQNDNISTRCTKSTSYYTTTNDDADDGLMMDQQQKQQQQHHVHKMHESTPFFNTNKYVNNNLNSELKYALQDTIGYDDGSVATRIKSTNSKISIKRCHNNANSNVKSSTLMNGTYTVGNKMRIKANSIKSNRKSYKFFLKNRQVSASKKSNEKMKQPEQDFYIPKPAERVIDDADDDDNLSNTSAHSDSLCDPLFSSTLKSSSSAICDDSSLQIEKKHDDQVEVEVNNTNEIQKVMATVTLSKTAFRKCLNKNQDDGGQYVNVQENVLFENSIEKMRRSVSLPGMNDQVSVYFFFKV